jgi:hypothetical protein
VPRVHYKGRQGDYYVMVRNLSYLISDLLFRLRIYPTIASLITSSVPLLKSDLLHFYPLLVQVMDMLGPSLWDVWNTSGQA